MGANDGYCDFCKAILTYPVWEYPVENFAVDFLIVFDGNTITPAVESYGPWKACHECSTIIDIDDKEGLVKRMETAIIKHSFNGDVSGPWPDFANQLAKHFLAAFTEHRTGQPVLSDE